MVPDLADWVRTEDAFVGENMVQPGDEFAGGQSHRPGVTKALKDAGITRLEDTYGGPPRRGPIPPPMATRSGHPGSSSTSRGHGGGMMGRGGRIPAPAGYESFPNCFDFINA